MAKSSVTEVRTSQGFDFIRELGQQLRVDSIRSSTTAGSGHPTSSMSAADLMAVLITRYFLYDWNDPQQPNNDHLIFSKGHASPLLYAIFKAVGVITDDEMLTFRKFGSRLQGHPQAHGRDRAHRQGQGLQRARKQRRLAWQGLATRYGRTGR